MNYEIIHKKYPKASAKFESWLVDMGEDNWTIAGILNFYGFIALPLEMQVGVLEKFFDEGGLCIEVSTVADFGNQQNDLESWNWYIARRWHSESVGSEHGEIYPTRPEAQIVAFEQAFSLYEEKLNSK